MTLRRHHREGLTVGVFLDLDHPGDAREVSEDRVVRRYLQLRFRPPRHIRDGGRLLGHLAPVAPQEVLPEPPLVLCRCCHLASLPTIVVVDRLPNVTKSVTKLLSHNFLAFRLTFLLYDPTRRTQPQRAMRRLHGPSHHRDQLVAQTVQGRLVPKFGRESFDSVSRVVPPAVEAWSMKPWMRRRSGPNNAAIATVEATITSCESPSAARNACCKVATLPPKYTPARVPVSEPYTSVRLLRTSMS